MAIAIFLILILAVSTTLFFQNPSFGSLPKGNTKLSIQSLPNYRKGKFVNESSTPDLAEDVSYFKVFKDYFFNNNKNLRPTSVLPSVKTNLHEINSDENVFIWFGHSSYFIQIDGKKLLVDPVFSGNASPIAGSVKSFAGTDVYTPDDIPEIDYLFISHDHWDHLDYKTILALKPKVKFVICGLGTGAHFKKWGFAKNTIIEKNWNEQFDLPGGFLVNTIPARHFSGRGLVRNKALWLSFALKTPSYNIFLGGDSGYDAHFKKAGEMHGPFDVAILECGQYDLSWKYIHMLPHEVLQAAKDLKAKKIIPVHWGKFKLANHGWNEPIISLQKLNNDDAVNIATPMIGEKMLLGMQQLFTKWWM